MLGQKPGRRWTLVSMLARRGSAWWNAVWFSFSEEGMCGSLLVAFFGQYGGWSKDVSAAHLPI